MHKLLVIDDDKITHAFIKRALNGKFDIADTFGGHEALSYLAQQYPDIILLDVEMPGMNGYEVCERIRSSAETADIPIIFLSARAELRDRLQGFEAGADDYIVKPFQPEELNAKINVLLQHRAQRQQLAAQVEEAQKTAFIAISSSSDLGQAIMFIEKTHTINSFEQLSRAFFAVSQSMQLKCSLMIKTANENLFFSSTQNAVSPIEAELMLNLSTEKRFFDFGCRTQINYPNICLLIKNMPLNDMERYGRIKDFFPAMLSAADIKVSQICTQQAIAQQLEEAHQTFASINGLLDNIKREVESNQKQGINIMRSMLLELDKRLPTMGLEEDQEQYIISQVDNAIDKAYSTISASEQISHTFQNVLGQLNTLLNHQQHLQHLLLLPSQDDFAAEESGYQMDVELF